MTWIAFLIFAFLLIGLRRRPSEGSKHATLLLVITATLTVVVLGFQVGS